MGPWQSWGVWLLSLLGTCDMPVRFPAACGAGCGQSNHYATHFPNPFILQSCSMFDKKKQKVKHIKHY